MLAYIMPKSAKYWIAPWEETIAVKIMSCFVLDTSTFICFCDRSKSVEPSGPLLEVQGSHSLYSGQRLQNTIQKLENAISSGKAAGEFQVNY